MANRLSADPSVEVVVLEAGPRDKDKFIHIPAGFAKLFRGGRVVDMKRLRIEALRERLDVLGGKGMAADLARLADADVLEELHDRVCII